MIPEDKDKKKKIEDKKKFTVKDNPLKVAEDKIKPTNPGSVDNINLDNTVSEVDNVAVKNQDYNDGSVIVIDEKKKVIPVRRDIKKLTAQYREELVEVLGADVVDTNELNGININKSPTNIGFLDVDSRYIKSDVYLSDSSDDGGESGYEADSESEPTPQAVSELEQTVETEERVTFFSLFSNYDSVLKKKKQFLYNNIMTTSTNFLLLNYINYLFYKRDWLLFYPDSIRFKLAVRKYKFRLNKYRNRLYYSKKVKFDISGSRAVVQLTSRYRNKFFTFLRKSLHFNLSVGRVFFWKLKKTVYGRVVNFYNVFFRCIIPFLSRRFTVLLYKLFRDWSSDFQKFNGAILRARRRRKIRRAYSIFKVVIFPKIIYGFMRSPKYPTRKRFLQRRSFIKYMCS